MLAIALAGNPSLLVADEPTTGLDVTTQSAILALLIERVRARHMAAILITHDLELARAYAERIIVMHAGQIVEDAPASALFSQSAPPLFRVADRGDARPRAQCRGARRHSRPERPISTPARRPAASPTAAGAPSRAAGAEFPPRRLVAQGHGFRLLAPAMSTSPRRHRSCASASRSGAGRCCMRSTTSTLISRGPRWGSASSPSPAISCLGWQSLSSPSCRGVWDSPGVFALASLGAAFRQGPLTALMTEMVPAAQRGSFIALRILGLTFPAGRRAA